MNTNTDSSDTSEQDLMSYLTLSPVPAAILKKDGSVTLSNERLDDLLGCSPTAPEDMIDADYLLPFQRAIINSQMSPGNEIDLRTRLLSTEGIEIPVILAIRALPDTSYITAAITDVTRFEVELAEAHQARAEALEDSLRDPLTGLFNRRYLDKILPTLMENADRYGKPIGFIFGDMYHFDEINNHHPEVHKAGDAALVRTARILQDNTKGRDIVVRYGGDEFLIVFPETNGEVKGIAENLSRAFDNNNDRYGQERGYNLILDMGVVHRPANEDNTINYILKADLAAKAAKAQRPSTQVVLP